MADIIVLDNRVDALEAAAKEARETLDDLDDRIDNHSDRLYAVEIWKNGNGARGAEARLQEVEKEMEAVKECLGASSSEEAIERIAKVTARGTVYMRVTGYYL